LKHTKYQRIILLSIITFSSFVRADTRIESQEILESMRGGEAIKFQNIMITGDLDFTELCDKILTLPEKEETIMEKVLGFFVEINIKENQEVQCDIEVPIEFMGCTFQDRVIGWINDEKNEVSYNAIFHNDIIFTNCSFKEDFLFKYSKFNGKADLSENNFNNIVLLKYAEFRLPVSFAESIFTKEANFKYTNIEEFVDFSETSFNGEANFKYTKFLKGVSFENSTFSENANFKYAELYQPVNLEGTHFNGDTDFKYTTIGGEEFVKYLLNAKID